MSLSTDILFRWKGDASGLQKSAGAASGAVGGVGNKMQKVSTGMVTAGKRMSLAALPVVAAFASGFKSLNENEALMAQTNAVLTSMGDASGKTAESVLGLANEISGYSGVAHESIVEGQNMLLTFGNIRNEVGEGNDVFDEATRLLTDMSVATGQDMSSAAVMMGKALNDPIEGLAAMSRVGIQFTEEQENMIRSMVEGGDVMGAQKIILGELTNQFGGSAEALGGTMGGQLAIAKNNFEALTRTLAEFLMPVLTQLTGMVSKVIDWFNNLSPAAQGVITKILVAAAVIGPLILIGGKLVGAFKAIKAAFIVLKVALLANPFALLIAAIVGLVILVVANWDKIVAFIKEAWERIKAAVDTAIAFVKGVIDTGIQTIIGWFTGFRDTVSEIWNNVWDLIKNLPGQILDGLRNIGERFLEVGKSIIDGIINGLGNIAKAIGDKLKAGITSAIDAVKGFFGIGSPSKVFAVQVGMPLMQGIAEGAAQAESATARKIKDAVRRLTPDVDIAGGTAPAGEPVHIHLHVGDEEFASWVLDNRALRQAQRTA
jgi:phage-related protein